ncbi:PspA/IM30 family protein [Mesotoga sp. UBA5847]|jgi:phage shock protein A|uniref:PspA/IM30 family protein n=1 Tax=Mesotoga sp. UBA5847 TaxID=1946859 RepID=UPI0025D04AD7|nr:PspA/IM30 family protein [Mesotoga sp. UBA5847]
MEILDRFNDIIKSNVNALLDKMENPSKMIDQYLRELTEDLSEVKRGTAGVIAEETRTKRLVDENMGEVAKYSDFAKRALLAKNDEDAKVFIAKKQELENVGAGLMTAYASAHENAVKMRQLHDKLVSDIESLKSKRAMIKTKVAVAKTQKKINEVSSAAGKTKGVVDAVGRMEEKAQKMLDEANAMSELNTEPIDKAKSLEEKYAAKSSFAVDEELEQMKKELGL